MTHYLVRQVRPVRQVRKSRENISPGLWLQDFSPSDRFASLKQFPLLGTVQADCSQSALDGFHRVSFDAVVRTMLQTGHDLPSLYRETAEGGLAAVCLNSPQQGKLF